MALTSVVVFDFFICCRGHRSGKKKTRSEEAIQGAKERENTGRYRMLGEKSCNVELENTAHNAENSVGRPIVFHLSKLIEGNRK